VVTVPVFAPGPYLAAFKPPRMAHSFRPSLGQGIVAEKPTPWWPRWINLAVIGAGAALALTTYSYRSKPLGALAFGAAASVVGVGLTFLFVDLVD